MRMNLAETWFINSTFRKRELRRRIATLVEERLIEELAGCRVLEVGCGQGVGGELLLERFGAGEVVGIDVDPKMIRRATRRLHRYDRRIEIRVGDVRSIDEPDASFDAVVDFAAIHHVPDWKRAILEIARVLRPGGQFVFEDHDVTRHSWVARLLFAHPAERFTGEEFVSALSDAGIEVAGDAMIDLGGHFVGVGRRAYVPLGGGSGPSLTDLRDGGPDRLPEAQDGEERFVDAP